MPDTNLQLFIDFGLALLLGAFMGLERERSRPPVAGMRTFPLISLFGGVAAYLSRLADSPWIIAAGLVGILAFAVTGNLLQAKRRPEPGQTTSVAMLLAFGVGALALYGEAVIAVALTFASTAVLYFKPHLHAFSHKVRQQDLFAVFQFGLLSFIILPLLPDQNLGPFNALNPYHIWLMVVLISGLSLTGYLILKVVGNRWGGPVMGLLGGLVSSTATTLAFSRQARSNSGVSRSAAVVILLASTVVMVRITVEVLVVNPPLIKILWLPLSLMFATGLAVAGLVWKHSLLDEVLVPETRNPAELTSALTFGLVYALVLLAVSAGKQYFGNEGVYGVSFVSGLTNVDAVTLSSARLAKTGLLHPARACNAIVIATVANMAFKLALVHFVGTTRLTRWAALGFGAMAAVGLAALAL